jgi:signal transduction histidine kinase
LEPVELTSLLAHELEPSLLSLESRLRSLLAEGSRREEVEACLAEVAAVRATIRDVLLLKTNAIEIAPFDLAPTLRSLESRFAPIARARGIALEVASGREPDAPRVEVLGNARAAERVLSNLIDNAIKFSRAGGVVALRITPATKSIAVEVVDRGVGISSSDQKRIFEPFVRLDRERPGSGLGLAIARTLAEAQQGELAVNSSAGEGSRFVLTLRRAGS